MSSQAAKAVQLSCCVILQLGIISSYVSHFLFAIILYLFQQDICACQRWQNGLNLNRCQRFIQHIHLHLIKHGIIAKDACRVTLPVFEHRSAEQRSIERQHIWSEVILANLVKISYQLSISMHHIIKNFFLLTAFKQSQGAHESGDKCRLVFSSSECIMPVICEIDFFFRVVMEIFLSHLRTILIQHVKSCIVGMLVGLNVSIQRAQLSLIHHKETLLCRYYRRQSNEGTMLQLSRSVGTSIKLRLSIGTILILPCYDRTFALVGESIAAM